MKHRNRSIAIFAVLFLTIAACQTASAPTLANSPNADTALARLDAGASAIETAVVAVNSAPPGMYTPAERQVVISHAKAAQAATPAIRTAIDSWRSVGAKPSEFTALATNFDADVAAARGGVR